MANKINRDDLLFYITREDLQNEAREKLRRTLTEDELNIAQKGLESGLMFDIETVYATIFNEMINEK